MESVIGNARACNLHRLVPLAVALCLCWTATAAWGSAYSDAVLADTPVAYWRLGEATGSTIAVDQTANHNNGTYVGSPTLGQLGAINGDADTAVDFNNTADYVEAPDSS